MKPFQLFTAEDFLDGKDTPTQRRFAERDAEIANRILNARGKRVEKYTVDGFKVNGYFDTRSGKESSGIYTHEALLIGERPIK